MNLLIKGVLSFISSAADWHASLSRGLAVPAIHFLCYAAHAAKEPITRLIFIPRNVDSEQAFPQSRYAIGARKL